MLIFSARQSFRFLYVIDTYAIDVFERNQNATSNVDCDFPVEYG